MGKWSGEQWEAWKRETREKLLNSKGFGEDQVAELLRSQGLETTKQYSVGKYFIDLVLDQTPWIAIEIDDSSKDLATMEQLARSRFILDCGYTMVRLDSQQSVRDPEHVLKEIRRAVIAPRGSHFPEQLHPESIQNLMPSSPGSKHKRVKHLSALCACGCGASIEQVYGRGRRRKYVNGTHKMRAQRARKKLIPLCKCGCGEQDQNGSGFVNKKHRLKFERDMAGPPVIVRKKVA